MVIYCERGIYYNATTCKDMYMGTIYILRNRISDKCYVGQTIRPFEKRFREHQISHSLIGKALRKYRVNNFDKLLLENIPEEELDYWEIHYIEECHSLYPNGYNFDTGGNIGRHTCEEIKRKMKKTHKTPFKKGFPSWNKGISPSEETRKKIGNASRGRIVSEETRKKRSDALSGENHPMFGKHHTEEMKEKSRESHKGQIPWNKGLKNPYSIETLEKMSEAQKKRYKVG
jgi:group I intron endonuclease